MDLPHHGYRASKQRGRGAPTGGESVLFDDTSASGANAQGYYTPGYNMAGPSNDMQAGVGNLFADPMASAAVMYGSSLANQGKDMVNKEGRPTRKRFALLVCLSDQQIHVGEQVEILLCRGHQIRDEETHDPHVPVHASGLGSSLPSRHSANTKTGRQRAGSLHPNNGFHYVHLTGWDGSRHSEEVQSGGAGPLRQHGAGVGGHRGAGHAAQLVLADGAQRPVHFRPHRLQWIQICRDDLQRALRFAVWQRRLLCGARLVLLCPYVLHCAFPENEDPDVAGVGLHVHQLQRQTASAHVHHRGHRPLSARHHLLVNLSPGQVTRVSGLIQVLLASVSICACVRGETLVKRKVSSPNCMKSASVQPF
ncbi:protein YIF1A isoform X1 [Vanacampus margaritifer]